MDARCFGHNRPGYPAGDGDQHLTGHRAGFMREQAHHRGHQFGTHRGICRNTQAFSHSRHGGRNDDVAQHAVRGAFERDDVRQADQACLGSGVVRDTVVAVQAADR